jgi:hypothetical protein
MVLVQPLRTCPKLKSGIDLADVPIRNRKWQVLKQIVRLRCGMTDRDIQHIRKRKKTISVEMTEL